MTKPVLSAKRRRKGFESVRKGYRSANARPMFFENGLLYCKLTVASDIWKGLLHVSLGAVGSWSFCALKQGLINLGKFQKDLICFVRRCGCGALIRGLQNLGTPCKGDVFRAFRLYEKNQKYTRGLRTSGLRGRFKALPEVILQKFPAACDETGFVCKTAAKRLWIGAKGRLYSRRKTVVFRKRVVLLQAHSRLSRIKRVTAR